MYGLGSFAAGLGQGLNVADRTQYLNRENELRAAGLEMANARQQREFDRQDQADAAFAAAMPKDGEVDTLTAAKAATQASIEAARAGNAEGYAKFFQLGAGLRKQYRDEALTQANQQFGVSGNPDVFRPVFNAGVENGWTWEKTEPAGDRVRITMRAPDGQEQVKDLSRDDMTQMLTMLNDPKAMIAQEAAFAKMQAEHALKRGDVAYTEGVKGEQARRTEEVRLRGQRELKALDQEGALGLEAARGDNARALEQLRQANPANAALVEERQASAGEKRARVAGRAGGMPNDPVLKEAKRIAEKVSGADRGLEAMTEDEQARLREVVYRLGALRAAEPALTAEQLQKRAFDEVDGEMRRTRKLDALREGGGEATPGRRSYREIGGW